MSLWLYHVGGFYSHIGRRAGNIPPNSTEIADALLGPKVNLKLKQDDVLQFILGITPCGASYVLLSHSIVEKNPELRALFTRGPWPSDRFISLSPIDFADASVLAAKIATLTNKNTKKGRDTSPANTAFTTGVDSIDVLQRAGINRASFEYHRVLYQLCRGTINPYDYDAKRMPWFGTIDTMWSFAYNTWSRDYRSLSEREETPKVLDVSWTEYIPPGSSEDINAINTSHFIVKENRPLQNPGAGAFLHGETSQVTHNEISLALQDIFTEAKRSRPVLLFVHDAKWALLILMSFGVDTSEWRVGIEPVLGRQILETRESHNGSRFSGTADYDQRYRSGRSRSPRDRHPVKRSRSPAEQQRSPFPVYVVDVKNLYLTMRQLSESNDNASVAAIAQALRIRYDKPDSLDEQASPNQTTPGWCAGNESRVLGYLWAALAGGNAIDEQRVARFDRIVQQTHLKRVDNTSAVASSSASTAPAPQARGGDDSDSEHDPNDFAPSASRPSIPVGRDPYASDEDDYFDF